MAPKFRKTQQPTITPQTFAAVLRSGSLTEQKAAHQRLCDLIYHNFQNHPRLHTTANRFTLHDKIQDIAQEYCENLLKNPRALAAAQVRGWGAVLTDLRRFLDRSDKFEYGNEKGPMRRLLHQNILDALRNNPTIFTYQKQSKRWHITNTPIPDPHDSPAFDLQTLKEQLPLLPAAPHDGRTDRTPNLVQTEELLNFLQITLKTANRPLNMQQLLNLVWEKLHPPPHINQPENDPDALTNHQNYVTHPPKKLPAHRLKQHAIELQTNLSPRVINVIYLYFRTMPQPSFRQIGHTLNIAHGTAANAHKEFAALLQSTIERHELSQPESAFMLEILLDSLQPDAFINHEPALDAGAQK